MRLFTVPSGSPSIAALTVQVAAEVGELHRDSLVLGELRERGEPDRQWTPAPFSPRWPTEPREPAAR